MSTLVELCAGAAACALYALGGRRLTPPVAWMGGKRRLAPDILAALQVDRGTLNRIVLVDASTWGWVWPILLGPDGERVGDVLRAWGAERGARDLWDHLVQQPPMQDPVERAAQWLWLQARSASGVPVWWGPDLEVQPEEGWRAGEEPGKARRGSRTAAQTGGAWMASDGRGVARGAGQKGGGWRMGQAEHRNRAGHQGARQAHAKSWVKASGGPAGCAAEPTYPPGEAQRGGGMTRPATIADRIDAIRWAIQHRRIRVDVVHGDVLDFEPIPGSHVVFDPPYLGRTGYGWKLPRPAVLEVAARHRAAGARVAVCEAEPLDALAGWAQLELAPGRASAEWLTLSHPPVARGQVRLFGAAGAA